MSYTRAGLAAYLAGELRVLAVRSGLSDLDSPEGYASAINRTYATLGLTRGATIGDDLDTKAEAVAKYHGLRRIWERLAILPPDAATAGDQAAVNARAAFANVEKLLAAARADLATLGIVLDGGGAAVFRLNLDLLEPAGGAEW